MSSIHSAVYSTPVKFAFGALSALSYKNAYQTLRSSALESKYQKILTKVMGEPGGRVSQVARRTSEVALWVGLGTLYALIAIAKPKECSFEDQVSNFENGSGKGIHSGECMEGDFFTSISNGLSHMDDMVLQGAGKKVSEFVQNNKLVMGISALVATTTAYFARKARPAPMEAGFSTQPIVESVKGAALHAVEGAQMAQEGVGEGHQGPQTPEAPPLLQQEGVQEVASQEREGNLYMRSFCWVADSLGLSDAAKRRLLWGYSPEICAFLRRSAAYISPEQSV